MGNKPLSPDSTAYGQLKQSTVAGIVVTFFLLLTPALAQPDRGSDDRMRVMIAEALDKAFQEQVRHLFEVWMKDPKGQPERAAMGIRRAVASYRRAIEAIETEKLTRKQ